MRPDLLLSLIIRTHQNHKRILSKEMLKMPTSTVGFIFGFLLVSTTVDFSYGDVEICTDGGTSVFSFKMKHCPSGVLFSEPVEFKCLMGSSSTDKTDWKEDVCGDAAYTDSSLRIQLMTSLDDEEVTEDESCMGPEGQKCDVPKMIVTEMLMKPMVKNSAEEYIPTPEETLLSSDVAVIDQTERMLKYLYGIVEDPDEDGPILRIVDLLVLSFEISHTYCTPPWLTSDLVKEILNAFLFVLRESDISSIKDVTLDQYERIILALTECKSQANGTTNPEMMMTITGSECVTETKIKTIKVGDMKRIKFQRTEKSFQLNKYDVVVDATWAMIDFVHGMCFNKFSPHFNSHHLYQQAMERLFTKEIVYRWARPTVLNTNVAWDAVFMGNVRTNMRNLEACIQGAYQGKPYLHRLERILDIQTHRRRKRSMNDANDLDGAGWCFQNEDEKASVLMELCPNTTTARK